MARSHPLHQITPGMATTNSTRPRLRRPHLPPRKTCNASRQRRSPILTPLSGKRVPRTLTPYSHRATLLHRLYSVANPRARIAVPFRHLYGEETGKARQSVMLAVGDFTSFELVPFRSCFSREICVASWPPRGSLDPQDAHYEANRVLIPRAFREEMGVPP